MLQAIGKNLGLKPLGKDLVGVSVIDVEYSCVFFGYYGIYFETSVASVPNCPLEHTMRVFWWWPLT